MVESKSRHQSVAKEEKRKKLMKRLGGTGGRTVSDKDFKNILKDLGLTVSQQTKLKNKLSKQFDKHIKNLEKLRKKDHSKFYKGKPHLKKGGKAKK